MVGPALRREPCRGAKHPGPQGTRRSFITVTLMFMGLVCWTLQAVGFSLNVMNWKESMKHACPALDGFHPLMLADPATSAAFHLDIT